MTSRWLPKVKVTHLHGIVCARDCEIPHKLEWKATRCTRSGAPQHESQRHWLWKSGQQDNREALTSPSSPLLRKQWGLPGSIASLCARPLCLAPSRRVVASPASESVARRTCPSAAAVMSLLLCEEGRKRAWNTLFVCLCTRGQQPRACDERATAIQQFTIWRRIPCRRALSLTRY